MTRYKETEIFNSMVLLDNNLELISVYDKNKLVPFGEYLPFENFFKKYGLKKIFDKKISFYKDVISHIVSFIYKFIEPLSISFAVLGGEIVPKSADCCAKMMLP